MFNEQERLQEQFTGFIRTPQLWTKNGIFEYDLFEFPQEIPADIASEAIEPPSTGVLGKRMEQFFKLYVERFSEEEVLAHNEQIFQEKQTVGELDFLLKHRRTGSITHVELVYKFYLYDPEITSEELRWIGPNRKDKLAKKLERLRQQQFPLLHHTSTEKLLERLGLSSTTIFQKLCFKASLFVPLEMESQKFRSINPAAIQGFWIRSAEFTTARFGDALFYSPQKQDWPILPGENVSWVSFSAIREEIEVMLQKKRSPLVWMKTTGGNFQRFFVVWW